MEKVLIGSGGFAREIKAHMGDFSIKCFVDNEYWIENNENIFSLSKFNPNIYEVIIAIGNPKDRFNMVQKLPKNTKYFTFIHPTVQILGDDINIGEGSIICAGCILTTNTKIGKNNYFGPYCYIKNGTTIADDNIFEAFVSVNTPDEHRDYFDGSSKFGVIIGHNNIFREYVTINGGTNRNTQVDNNVTMLRGSHLGHDCIVEDWNKKYI